MKSLPKFIAVVHVQTPLQAVHQTDIALHNGAGGVFLIDHHRPWARLARVYEAVRICFADAWIGLNYLDLRAREAIRHLPACADGLWMDYVGDIVDGVALPSPPRRQLLFAGTAFKYQGQPDDLAAAAKTAAELFDVVTTSGPATGEPATIDKVRVMKEAIGKRPLALASGVTPDNIQPYLPYVDCFMVATGISSDFHSFFPAKVRAIADTIAEFHGKESAWA